MTRSPVVSASPTHSIAQTWVTMTIAPGRAPAKIPESRATACFFAAARAASLRRVGTRKRSRTPWGVQGVGGCAG
ncbi:hypothetical protein QFZ71_002097 [Streptomyces sp. V2I9]|nr:hypothetical protein [Streptomyces sp. V2I9]